MSDYPQPLDEIKNDWISDAIPKVLEAFAGKVWTSDDLHKLLGRPEVDNWFGALVATMRNRRLIERTGSRASERAEANGRWIAEWRVV